MLSLFSSDLLIHLLFIRFWFGVRALCVLLLRLLPVTP
jgi:hypothetical protein